MEMLPGKKDELAAKYDLAPLFDDIRSIIDVPGAIQTVVKWSAIVPVVSMVLAILVTTGESPWMRFPYTIAAGAISLAAAAALGVFVLLRRRFESAEKAIGRTLETVEQIHGDLSELRDGERNRGQVIAMAENLVSGVVLPAMDEAVLLVPQTSLPIPIPDFLVTPLARAITWGPKRVVERGVMKSVEALPWEDMVQKLENQAQTAAEASEFLTVIREGYSEVQGKLEHYTRMAARVSQGPVLIFLVLSIIPILIWLALGLIL